MKRTLIAVALAACTLLCFGPAARAEVIVSLGDSYSSGEGAGDYDAGTNGGKFPLRNNCHRSRWAWPRMLGASREHHLACSGAKLKHLDDGQSTGADGRGQLERLEAIVAEVDVDTVVMTMSGNDMDFGGKVKACRLAPRSCLRDLDKLDREFDALRPRLVAAYRRIAATARGARVVIAGYPDIVPGAGEPFQNCSWLNAGERRAVAHLSEKFDATLTAAAAEAEVHYAPVRDALDGHELCTKDSYVVPIRAGQGLVGTKDIQEMGHPTYEGQLRIMLAVRRFLRALDAPPPGCVPATSIAAIVDDSGSMDDNDPADIRRRALELLLTKPSSDGTVMSAVEFGTDAGALFGPLTLTADGLPAVLATLDGLAEDGYRDTGSDTDYNLAFAAAAALHPTAAARIFLTDGEHTEGQYADAHAGGPPTFVVGLDLGPPGAGDDGADLLARIARETGGEYFPLRRDSGDDVARQVARIQPVLNAIDAKLRCSPAVDRQERTLAKTGATATTAPVPFAGKPDLEVVASWVAPGADVDLVAANVRNKRGKVIADLAGERRIAGTRRTRAKLAPTIVEGATFETVSVTRPRGGRTLSLRFKAQTLQGPMGVTIQARPLVQPAPAAPSPAPPSGTPANPVPTPAPTPAPAPLRTIITVDNRVTNGMAMSEDSTPVRLTTQPWTHCGSRGCNIAGTERASGGTYDAAVCQTTGERTTNGNDSDPGDDANPLRFESTRYYGVRLTNGTFGYVSEVWIRAADRGGLGMPSC